MNRREVWTPVNKLPFNKIYWIEMVFNIKGSRDYISILEELGCNQIPGKASNNQILP